MLVPSYKQLLNTLALHTLHYIVILTDTFELLLLCA